MRLLGATLAFRSGCLTKLIRKTSGLVLSNPASTSYAGNGGVSVTGVAESRQRDEDISHADEAVAVVVRAIGIGAREDAAIVPLGRLGVVLTNMGAARFG